MAFGRFRVSEFQSFRVSGFDGSKDKRQKSKRSEDPERSVG
jgi:hypothetical protein